MEKPPFPKERYTKYELARILGARALQLSYNAPILIKIDKEKLEDLGYDPVKIAELELNEGILPISIKRPLPRKLEKKSIKEAEGISKIEKLEKVEAQAEKAEKKEIKEIKEEIEEKAEKKEKEAETTKEKSEEEKILEEIKSAEKESEEETEE
jgi:DNA-directed RNA polymerase subunit K